MSELKDIIMTYGAIPPLTSFKRPMFVGPHPDDIEFGCGGLIAKMKKLNIPVTFVIVTDGAAGGDLSAEEMKTIREAESKEAASFLGTENVEFCELEDGGDYSVEDAIKVLIPLVLKYHPDIIFAPDPLLKTECHPDHLKTGEAVRRLLHIVSHRESVIRHGISLDESEVFPSDITLAFYFSDDSNILEEITAEDLETKIKALLHHRSQMQDGSTELLLNYFKLKAAHLGKEVGSGLAEDYRVLVPLTQHVYSEGIHYNKW